MFYENFPLASSSNKAETNTADSKYNKIDSLPTELFIGAANALANQTPAKATDIRLLELKLGFANS